MQPCCWLSLGEKYDIGSTGGTNSYHTQVQFAASPSATADPNQDFKVLPLPYPTFSILSPRQTSFIILIRIPSRTSTTRTSHPQPSLSSRSKLAIHTVSATPSHISPFKSLFLAHLSRPTSVFASQSTSLPLSLILLFTLLSSLSPSVVERAPAIEKSLEDRHQIHSPLNRALHQSSVVDLNIRSRPIVVGSITNVNHRCPHWISRNRL